MAKRNVHVGTKFDDFLVEENHLERSTAIALKRVIAWQLDQARKAQGMSKKAMAELMGTSRSHLDRLLDSEDTGLTIETLSRAADVLGCRVRVELAA